MIYHVKLDGEGRPDGSSMDAATDYFAFPGREAGE